MTANPSAARRFARVVQLSLLVKLAVAVGAAVLLIRFLGGF